MRLIDADKLKTAMRPYGFEMNVALGDQTWEDVWFAEERIIDNAPTVDPVKHGKWEWQDSSLFGNPYGSYMCPLCQDTVPHKTNYCPNCGAMMGVV